jgi:hypothetical protein
LRVNLVVNIKVVIEFINGNGVLSGVVLESTSKEGLGEEEPRDPIGWWHGLVNPLGNEVNSVVQIVDPGGERLKRQEAYLSE